MRSKTRSAAPRTPACERFEVNSWNRPTTPFAMSLPAPTHCPLRQLADLPLSRFFFLQFVINLDKDPEVLDQSLTPSEFALTLFNLDFRSLCFALSTAPSGNTLRSAQAAVESPGLVRALSSSQALNGASLDGLHQPVAALLNAFQKTICHHLSARGWRCDLNDEDNKRLSLSSAPGFGFFKVGSAYLIAQPVVTAEQADAAGQRLLGDMAEFCAAFGIRESLLVCLQRGQLATDEFSRYAAPYKTIDDRLFSELLRHRERLELEESVGPSAPSLARPSL